MKTANFVSLGALPTFSVSESADNYWEERANYEWSAFVRNLSLAGISVSQAETSDLSTYAGDWQDALDDWGQRLDEILANGFSEVIVNLPDVLPIIGALLSGGAEPVLSILLDGVLRVLNKQLDSRVAEAGGEIEGGSIDFTEVIEKLEEIRAEIETTLAEFNINMYNEEYQQSWSVGPVAPD